MRERNNVLETNDSENFASGLEWPQLLAYSIVRYAVIDFKKYLELLTNKLTDDKYNKIKNELFDILKFFNSEWYTILCDIHPDVIFKQLQAILKNYLKKNILYIDLIKELLNFIEEKNYDY